MENFNKVDAIISNYESFLLINEEISEDQNKQDKPIQIQFDNEILGIDNLIKKTKQNIIKK
jgi:hypothetical protein